jgi:MtN3 and saliva related transmembrane protein
MLNDHIIGSLAAILTTVSFSPQVLKTFKTKDVSGISIGMYGMFSTGVALWVVYGVMLKAWPIIIANILTFGMAASILVMKVRYTRTQS